MSDLKDLYQEMILDHGKRPRNFRAIEDATHDAEGFNPLCGDRLHVYLRVESGVVRDAAFKGSGCAISTASASLMTEAVKGGSVQDAERLFAGFHAMLTGHEAAPATGLGKLAVFSGVREFPVRVKCATLAWHTMKSALARDKRPATTE
jgi:nitrogen fixation NifU-like protein